MDLCRLAARALANLGLASAIASAITSPAHAATSAITMVQAEACSQDTLELEWAKAVLDAYRTLPSDGDPRLSVTLLLDPQFAGDRPFHEPSGFRALTTSSWDYTPRVADDVVTTAVIGNGDAPPHVLAGHALYGMGKQVVVLTVGTAVDELRQWKNDPVHYYASHIPGISSTYQVMTAPSTAAAYRQFALTIPAQWQSFLDAKDTEQAERIGAVAATVGVALQPYAKGTGSAAADGALARWNKSYQSVLDKGRTPSTRPLPDPKPASTPTPRNAFQIATEGGKHAGFLENYRGRSAREIQKGISSIESQIVLHQDKIANPRKHIPEWDTFDPRRQKALLEKKWPSDIERQREEADVLRGLLEEKS